MAKRKPNGPSRHFAYGCWWKNGQWRHQCDVKDCAGRSTETMGEFLAVMSGTVVRMFVDDFEKGLRRRLAGKD